MPFPLQRVHNAIAFEMIEYALSLLLAAAIEKRHDLLKVSGHDDPARC